MANKTAVLFQRIKIGSKWTYRKVSTKRLPRLSEGAYYLSWYEGTDKQFESVGPDPDVAKVALGKKSAELAFIATGGEVKQDESKAEPAQRVKVSKAVEDTSTTVATGKGSRDMGWRGEPLRRTCIACNFSLTSSQRHILTRSTNLS